MLFFPVSALFISRILAIYAIHMFVFRWYEGQHGTSCYIGVADVVIVWLGVFFLSFRAFYHIFPKLHVPILILFEYT